MISREQVLGELSELGRYCRSVSLRRRLAPFEAEELHADALYLAWTETLDHPDLETWRTSVRSRIRSRACMLANPHRPKPEYQPEPYSPDPMIAVDVADEIASLSPEEQALLACRAYDMTEDETAQVVGLSRRTVDRRLAAIRAKLTA